MRGAERGGTSGGGGLSPPPPPLLFFFSLSFSFFLLHSASGRNPASRSHLKFHLLFLILRPDLPDPCPQCLRSYHRIAVFASPRRLEFRHVAERPVHAPHRRGVLVGVHLRAQSLRTIHLTPNLRPAEEEPLLGRESIDLRARG